MNDDRLMNKIFRFQKRLKRPRESLRIHNPQRYFENSAGQTMAMRRRREVASDPERIKKDLFVCSCFNQ